MATSKAPAEPKFESLAVDLAKADATSRSASADANQARAQRSTLATSTIKAAFSEKIDRNVVRRELLNAGVLKGTVSKIITVLAHLEAGSISVSDVKSLNGAYALAKAVTKATSAGAPAASVTVTPSGKAIGPDDALDIIIKSIRAEKDPDKRFALAGVWLTKVTDAVTAVTREIEDEDE